MIKVLIVSDSAVLSKNIGIKLISKGYYANHLFPSQILKGDIEKLKSNVLQNISVIVFDQEGTKKTLGHDKSENLIDILSQISNNLILISSEKDVNKIKSWFSKGLKGIVDSSLNLSDISEKVYEIVYSIPIEDSDRRKHYRVRVPNGSISKIFINPEFIIRGHIYDVSAGGVSIIFDSYEKANSLITNKSYQSQLEFEGISINANIFLVRREGTLCGFRFFNIDNKHLTLLSEYIYHRIIEDTYNETLTNKV